MESQIKLGRLFGVEIGLHYSWFLIALLIVLSLAGHFRETQPQWGPATTWTAAAAPPGADSRGPRPAPNPVPRRA